VLTLKNKERLIISVNLLQRSVAAEIDRDCLVPIGKQLVIPEKVKTTAS
jgi:hypothetical protein